MSLISSKLAKLDFSKIYLYKSRYNKLGTPICSILKDNGDSVDVLYFEYMEAEAVIVSMHKGVFRYNYERTNLADVISIIDSYMATHNNEQNKEHFLILKRNLLNEFDTF